MSKITSKFQVTLPRRLAETYGLKPGDDIEFVAAGDIIHVLPPSRPAPTKLSGAERLRAFDAATKRQRRREQAMNVSAETFSATSPEQSPESSRERDWTRESLYDRKKPG